MVKIEDRSVLTMELTYFTSKLNLTSINLCEVVVLVPFCHEHFFGTLEYDSKFLEAEYVQHFFLHNICMG